MTKNIEFLLALSVGLGVVGSNAGCSIRQMAISGLADALAGGGSVYASDDDPELVRQALPFSLKLIESVLAESPRDSRLLLAACSGFTQYSYAFVQQDADEREDTDVAAAVVMRDRARLLYLRARDYGLRGLDAAVPGFAQQLRDDAKAAVRRAGRKDVPLLYWTAAAWGAAIAVSKDEPNLIVEQLIVEAMMDRALELNEAFDDGAIHSFLITYETARQGSRGTAAERIRPHFDRAVELSGGLSAAPLVAMAEAVAVQEQNKAEFESLLKRALAIDVNARPQSRLLNLVLQRRAKWLLSRTSELFVD